MNPRVELNNYCTENNLAFIPEYRSSGPPHDIRWTGRCKIVTSDKVVFAAATTEKEFATKKDLDKHLSEILLRKLRSTSSGSVIRKETATRSIMFEKEEKTRLSHTLDLSYLNKLSFTEIYLIDLENIPLTNIGEKPGKMLIGFTEKMKTDCYERRWSIIHSDTEEIDLNKGGMVIYTIDAGYKDMVDHFITMFVYPLSVWIKRNNFTGSINVMTKDNAGRCTLTLLNYMITMLQLSNKISLIHKF